MSKFDRVLPEHYYVIVRVGKLMWVALIIQTRMDYLRFHSQLYLN